MFAKCVLVISTVFLTNKVNYFFFFFFLYISRDDSDIDDDVCKSFKPPV